jgi:hypothetical protein
MDEISLSDAATDAAPKPGHNRLQALLSSAVHYGSQAAFGVTALQLLGLDVIEASFEGWVRPESANAIAQNYVDGSKNAGGTPGSVNTLASKFRKLMGLGKLNDGPKIAKEALRLRSEIEKPKSPFETLVELARHCLKSKSCDLADDEIKIIIAKQKREQAAKPEEQEAEEPPSYEIPWADILDTITDRETLMAFREEIVARLRQIDRMLTETHAEQIEVNDAAHAPPAANTLQEDATATTQENQ